MYRIESSIDPVIILKGAHLLDCNDAALRLFGYDCEKDHFLILKIQDLLLELETEKPLNNHRIINLLEQVYEEGVWKEVVLCQAKKEGRFLAELQLFSFQKEDGELIIISKWKKYKGHYNTLSPPLQVLNEPLEDQFPLLLNLNQEGKIVYANPPACAFFNYTEGEIVKNHYLNDLIDKARFKAGSIYELPNDFLNLQKPEQGTYRPKKVTFINKDNQRIEAWVNLSFLRTECSGSDLFQMQILPKEQLEYADLVSENTHPQYPNFQQENRNLRRIQKILKKSIDRMRVLAEYSPDAIMQYNRAFRHLFVNSQVNDFTGYSPKEFLGKSFAEIGFPEEFSTSCEAILEEVFASGKRKRVELMFPKGVWVDWYLIPEFNSKGEVNTIITTARDITEQKKTQIKLQKSERKLNDAFEVTKLSSWSFLCKSNEIKASRNLAALLGIESESDKTRIPVLQFLSDFVLEEDRGKILFVIDAAQASCSEDFKEIVDFRIRDRKGDIVHILASVRLGISKDGKLEKGYGTAQDITQLRLTEQELEEYRTSLERLVETRTQELKKSEEKLADALRLANLGTWEYDPLMEGFLVSNEVFEIIGSTPEIEGGNVVGVPRIRDIIHSDDYQFYREAVLSAQESTEAEYTDHAELRIFRSDGEIRHIYLSIKTSRAGKQMKFFGTLQDITDIRKAEYEKERLNAIIEATSDIVGIVHPAGNLLYLNKAGKDFFGMKEDDSHPAKAFQNFSPGISSRVLASKVLKAADKTGTWSGQSQFIRYDGVEVPVSQVVVAHKNAQEQIECYSTILRDISQQKKIEQDLIYKNNELDTFVYRASHDLRGPIATLMGLYNLVQYEVKDEHALSLFDMYNSQILRLNTIILTLIELTKIKEREFKPSVVNFKKMVRNVYSKMQGMTESKDMLFEQDIEPVEGYVSDEHLLFVIMQNMIENSIKYKRQDTDSFVRVEVKRIKDTDKIQIKVSDNGIGIDSAIQNKIYNMFFRGNERSSGSGLGLYILKNAVEKLGGKVALYSVMYKGTTFKIELPPLKK